MTSLKKYNTLLNQLSCLPDSKIDLNHEVKMIHYRYLSEVDRLIDEMKMSKKELAEKLGVSASYITQLFKGEKILNLEMIAKLQIAFNLKFDIEAKEFIDKSLPLDEPIMICLNNDIFETYKPVKDSSSKNIVIKENHSYNLDSNGKQEGFTSLTLQAI